MARIKVRVSKVGDSKIDVEGASGSGCVTLTQAVEAALAGTPGQREYKPEYDEVEVQQTVENG
jgi:hypothetical protein